MKLQTFYNYQITSYVSLLQGKQQRNFVNLLWCSLFWTTESLCHNEISRYNTTRFFADCEINIYTLD